MEAIHPETVKFAMGLKHNRVTDLSKGEINNQDFIILMLWAFGPFGLTELRELSRQWRGNHCLESYFGPHNGYTGLHFDTHDRFHLSHAPAQGAPKHHPYWYRASQGVPGKTRYTNALSLHGVQRLAQLRESAAVPELSSTLGGACTWCNGLHAREKISSQCKFDHEPDRLEA